MKTRLITALFLFFFTLVFSSYVKAQPKSLETDTSKILVGVAGSEPFVKGDAGVSLEIWKRLMDKLGFQYQIKNYDNVPQALQALKDGEINAVAGPISITSERAENAKFSQPYFESGISILSHEKKSSLWDKISPFFSYKFFIALVIFIFILGVVGTLLWWTERKVNTDEFPMEPASGIANGMWCAIVTMSTTGYGDRSPRTFWGRFVAGTWMVISLIFTTSMIAGIASVLTLSSIGVSTLNNAESLSGKRIGVVSGSPAETFVRRYGGRTVTIENVNEGFDKLSQDKLDAVVYDRPQLLYYLKEHPEYDFQLSEAEYDRLGYGFAFPLDYDKLHLIDENLLEIEESGVVNGIVEKWLGESKK